MTENEDQDLQTKEQKKIVNIYAFLSAGLVLSFVPVASAALLGTVMFIGTFIYLYSLRKSSEPESLSHDHTTFLIRTIWIVSLFSIFTMAIAVVYVLSVYDPTPVHDCVNQLMGGHVSDMTYFSAVGETQNICVDNFVKANLSALIIGGIIAMGPLAIYLVYRVAKGLSRAMKGHRIGDVKSWF